MGAGVRPISGWTRPALGLTSAGDSSNPCARPTNFPPGSITFSTGSMRFDRICGRARPKSGFATPQPLQLGPLSSPRKCALDANTALFALILETPCSQSFLGSRCVAHCPRRPSAQRVHSSCCSPGRSLVYTGQSLAGPPSTPQSGLPAPPPPDGYPHATQVTSPGLRFPYCHPYL